MTIYIKEYFRNTMWMKQIQIRIKIKIHTKYLDMNTNYNREETNKCN